MEASEAVIGLEMAISSGVAVTMDCVNRGQWTVDVNLMGVDSHTSRTPPSARHYTIRVRVVTHRSLSVI